MAASARKARWFLPRNDSTRCMGSANGAVWYSRPGGEKESEKERGEKKGSEKKEEEEDGNEREKELPRQLHPRWDIQEGRSSENIVCLDASSFFLGKPCEQPFLVTEILPEAGLKIRPRRSSWEKERERGKTNA